MYESEPYYILTPDAVEVVPSKTIQIVVARILEEEYTHSEKIQKIQFCTISEQEKQLNDIEICRYLLQEGARLRIHYTDFSDMDTTYNTISLLYSEWAAYQKRTISPKVLEEFAIEALRMPNISDKDYNFIQLIHNINGEGLNSIGIQTYVASDSEAIIAL